MTVFTVQETAEQLGMGPRKLFAWLRTHRLIDAMNVPYPTVRSQGYMRVSYRSWRNAQGFEKQYARPLVTPQGVEWIRHRIEEEKHESDPASPKPDPSHGTPGRTPAHGEQTD